MKILVYPPNKPPYTHDITTFKELQDLVGGRVEISYPANMPYPIAINEDGQALQLEPNLHWAISHKPPPCRSDCGGRAAPLPARHSGCIAC